MGQYERDYFLWELLSNVTVLSAGIFYVYLWWTGGNYR